MEYPPHALVSNVTPWWWGTHQDGKRSKLAIDVMRDVFNGAPAIQSFTIRMDGIEVEVAIDDADDVSHLQSFTDGIRERLDALVSGS
jgi:hypothetical protein